MKDQNRRKTLYVVVSALLGGISLFVLFTSLYYGSRPSSKSELFNAQTDFAEKSVVNAPVGGGSQGAALPAPDSDVSSGLSQSFTAAVSSDQADYVENYFKLAPELKSIEKSAVIKAEKALQKQKNKSLKAQQLTYINTYLQDFSVNSKPIASILPSQPKGRGQNSTEAIIEGVEADSNYRNNVVNLIREAGQSTPASTTGIPASERVLSIVPDNGYPDCVAVRIEMPDGRERICSGTLIAPRVISSAAHCYYAGATYEVFFGPNIFERGRGVPRGVREPVHHQLYQSGNPTGHVPPKNDIMLLFLAEDAPLNTCPVRRIAPSSLIRNDAKCRVVGYGSNSRTGSGGEGIRRRANVGMRSADCSDDAQQQLYSCAAGSELVAGHSISDTCYGDSGGPLYIQDPNTLQWLVAGITSRGIPCNSPDGCVACGQGGIYTRLINYYDWIKEECEKRDVTPPEKPRR